MSQDLNIMLDVIKNWENFNYEDFMKEMVKRYGWRPTRDENINLDDALQMFADQNQEPDGFLMRLVVFDDDDVDISPLTVSVEGLCMTHDLSIVVVWLLIKRTKLYILDIVGMVGFNRISSTLKDWWVDGVIISSAMKMGLQQPFRLYSVDRPRRRMKI